MRPVVSVSSESVPSGDRSGMSGCFRISFLLFSQAIGVSVDYFGPLARSCASKRPRKGVTAMTRTISTLTERPEFSHEALNMTYLFKPSRKNNLSMSRVADSKACDVQDMAGDKGRRETPKASWPTASLQSLPPTRTESISSHSFNSIGTFNYSKSTFLPFQGFSGIPLSRSSIPSVAELPALARPSCQSGAIGNARSAPSSAMIGSLLPSEDAWDPKPPGVMCLDTVIVVSFMIRGCPSRPASPPKIRSSPLSRPRWEVSRETLHFFFLPSLLPLTAPFLAEMVTEEPGAVWERALLNCRCLLADPPPEAYILAARRRADSAMWSSTLLKSSRKIVSEAHLKTRAS
jgi:hypothetical protein